MRDILTAVIAITLVASCAPEEALEQVGDTLNLVGGGVMMSHDSELVSVSRIAPDHTRVEETFAIGFLWSNDQDVLMAVSPDQLATIGLVIAYEELGDIDVVLVDMRTGVVSARMSERQILSALDDYFDPTETGYYGLEGACWSASDQFVIRLQYAPEDTGGAGPVQSSVFIRYSSLDTPDPRPAQIDMTHRPLGAEAPAGFTCRAHRYAAGARLDVDGRSITLDGTSLPGAPDDVAVTGVVLPSRS